MRKLITLLLVVITFYSCKEGWSQDEKDTYMTHCVAAMAKNGFETKLSQDYCQCMMDKTQKQAPDINDADKITEATRSEWARECLKQ